MVKCTPIDREFQNIIKELKAYLQYLQKDFLVFQHENKTYSIDWAEMALTVRCPKCGKPTPLSNDLRVKAGKYRCQNIDCKNNKGDGFDISTCERSCSQYLYLINSINNEKTHKEFDLEDKEIFNNHINFLKSELSKNNIIVPQDVIPLDTPWVDLDHTSGTLQPDATKDLKITFGADDINEKCAKKARLFFQSTDFLKAETIIEVTVNFLVNIAETHGRVAIQVYPNPTTGQLTIDNEQLTIKNVEIFDIYGKKQLSIINCPLSIKTDISYLPSGIYLLRVGNDWAKVVKQ